MRRVLALLFAAFLAGCHRAAAPTLKAAAPPRLAGGWTAAFDPASGVSVGLPPGWRVGVARTLDAASLMNGNVDLGSAGGPAQEAGAELVRQEEAAEKASLAKMREKEGIVLHATDGSKPTPAEEPTRLYVKKLPDAGFGSLEDAAAAERSDNHVEMKKEAVELPVGKAIRLEAKGRNRIGDEECHVSYVFVDGKDAYVLRFASTNNPDVILSVDRPVAETFRVVAKGK